MTVIAALAVALNLLLAQTVPVLTLERVAELEEGLNLNAVLASRVATYVPSHRPVPAVGDLSRSYWIEDVEGRPLIWAQYLGTQFRREAGVRLGQPDEIADGGCNVIWVVFDPDSGRPIGAWCNGVA